LTTVVSELITNNENADGHIALELPASLLHNRQLLLNRELSWVEFNRRVLEEALDTSHPLLERLKFLSIFSTNLDEFFMVRVSGLKEEIEHGITEESPDGMSPQEQLKEISRAIRPVTDLQMRCLREDILPKLEAENIVLRPIHTLSKKERTAANDFFFKNIFPVLTPQAVDPSHRFPYISDRSLNLGLMVEPAKGNEKAAEVLRGGQRFARIKVPPSVNRLVPVGNSPSNYIFVGELIAANISSLFPGMELGPCHMFRVTRDADFEIREDEAGDLLSVLEQQLIRRRFGGAVRLEVASTMPPEMVAQLSEALRLTLDDVYSIDGPLNLPDLMMLYDLPRPDLKDKPLQVTVPSSLKESPSFFDVMKKQDILLHHPYTAYSTVTDFIDKAARDKDVLAIKMCLYRTGQRSPIVQSLMKASELGKQVAVLVELKARFDEENNIEWARQLERAGVHVVYGLIGLKTHCKVALVVRREGDALRRYVHIATGNYNPTTSRIYTDIGLLTTDPDMTADVTELFNFLTGYSYQPNYRKLLIAPVNMRERMHGLITRETEHALGGRTGRIIVKINSLTDVDIIRDLYEASQAGVQIDLIVRGVCSLRPGVPGLSENINVTSIVGRFLEHSRIFYFSNGGEEEVYIGSADWMKRNLDRRVEVVTPITDPELKRRLREDVLDVYLLDNSKARRLLPDGSYARIEPEENRPHFDAQKHFEGRSLVSGLKS
jgi:polyphosphate kinase